MKNLMLLLNAFQMLNRWSLEINVISRRTSVLKLWIDEIFSQAFIAGGIIFLTNHFISAKLRPMIHTFSVAP